MEDQANRDLIQLKIDMEMKKNQKAMLYRLKYINKIYAVDGNKGIKLKELNAVEFYDDTNGVLEVVLQYCKEGNFCTKLFKVDPLLKYMHVSILIRNKAKLLLIKNVL